MYQLLMSHNDEIFSNDLFDSYCCLLDVVSPLIGESREDIYAWDENTRTLASGTEVEWITYFGDIGIDGPEYCASCGERLDTWNMTDAERADL